MSTLIDMVIFMLFVWRKPWDCPKHYYINTQI